MRTLFLAGGLTAAAVAVVVGTASTDSNTIPSHAVGYGTAQVSGATATSISYVRDSSLANITEVDLTFAGELINGQHAVDAGFNGGTPQPCTIGTFTDDGSGNGTGTTQVTCSFSASPVPVSTATALNVAVNGPAILHAAP